MGFKNKEHSILFCVVCICFFWGVSSFMLINDWIRIPLKVGDPDSFAMRKNLYEKTGRFYPDYWVINSFDGKITNIENIIIWIFMFWGFLRGIDLMRLMIRRPKNGYLLKNE